MKYLAPLLLAFPAFGQSLFLRPVEPPIDFAGQVDATAHLRQVSMIAVEVPKPREFAVHDLVTIIIDESSRSSSEQTLDTKKESSADVGLNAMLSPRDLLELQLRQGNLSNLSLLDFDTEREFKGEGEYERTDRFSARITAEVIDVKPNGTLVLEARKEIVRDEEATTIVLSGICRREDITGSNTILSSQLADLQVVQNNSGKVKDAAKKGLFTNIFDAVFNF